MNPRFQAISIIQQRNPLKPIQENVRASKIFGEHVFDNETIKHYLSSDLRQKLRECVEQGATLDRVVAGSVANVMKTWAIDKGATHYMHWFQPLTGMAAEKHQSFLDFSDGRPIEMFSGNQLVQQEPDVSSFSPGDIRSTFEARGYSAWDPGSPPFVLETSYGKTLCIPTVFVSYKGQSLDFKIPLLKSLSLLEKAALDICHFFDKNIKSVFPTLGAEQEFYLIDKALYDLRPDLIVCGRTLIGASVARAQQFSDSYFGSIPERVYAFMHELEYEAHKVGIPLKTRHNEVAPGQFEVAPKYQELNLGVDHGQILIALIERIARKHHFKALLHEKPFANINGSGKHNNWSLKTDTGKNLLSPGNNPKENLMFLAFFTSVINAFHQHADLLRASIASIGNDRRLGALEAPPNIMSIFIGSQLSSILDDVEVPPRKKKNAPMTPYLRLGIKKIPELLRHNTDSNRTSPFAFTGNKFEFRAVGASMNNSSPMMILCLSVADQLINFRHRVERKMARSRKKEAAILDVIKDNITASKSRRFEGDGYGEAWEKEAKKRGLSNIKTTPEALEAYISSKSIDLFVKNDIFSKEEVKGRYEVLVDDYLNRVRIEAEMLEELVLTTVIPPAIDYQKQLLKNVQMNLSIGLEANLVQGQKQLIERMGGHINEALESINQMKEARQKADGGKTKESIAKTYAKNIVLIMEKIRLASDELELLVPDEHWILPKYRELLFVR